MAVQGIRGGQLKILAEEQVYQTHLATLEVLEEVGVRVDHRQALEVMADNGCRVDFDKRVVRIPEYVLKKSLQTSPSRITLFGKTSEWDVVLDDTDVVYTMGGAGALWVLDLEGDHRPSTLKDLVDLTRIQNTLENLHIAHWLVCPQDIPQKAADRIIFATMLKNTQRHQHIIPGGPGGVKDHLEMAAVLQGSIKEAREKPIFVENVCVTSPLLLPDPNTQELIEVAREGIPMLIEADAVAGATSPFTIAGCLVEQNATILSAIALAQMINPGVPCIYSSSSGIMDMSAGNYSAAAPESTLIHLAATQVAHYYHLPFQGGNTCDSKVPDAQMGYERASHFVALALGGCNIIHVATGNLEQMRLASYEQCVIDDEILGASFRIARGIEFTRDTLAIDALKEVGPGGNFLAHAHTLRYLRKTRWFPNLSSRENWDTWQMKGGKDMRERARERVRKILSEPYPEYVSAEAAREIDKIARRAQEKVLNQK